MEWNEWLDDYKQKKKDGKTSKQEMQKTDKDHVEQNSTAMIRTYRRQKG